MIVRIVQPLGPVTIVTLAWAGGTLTARSPGISALQAGQTATVALDPDYVMLFDRETGLLLD